MRWESVSAHSGVVQSVGHVEPMDQVGLHQLGVFVADLLVQRKSRVRGVGVEHQVRVFVHHQEVVRFVKNTELGKDSLYKALNIAKLPYPNTFHEKETLVGKFFF